MNINSYSPIAQYQKTAFEDEEKSTIKTEGAIAQIEKAIEVQRAEAAKKAELEAKIKESNPPGSREWIA